MAGASGLQGFATIRDVEKIISLLSGLGRL